MAFLATPATVLPAGSLAVIIFILIGPVMLAVVAAVELVVVVLVVVAVALVAVVSVVVSFVKVYFISFLLPAISVMANV